MNRGLFTKDFTLVVIGQIISLFGNAVLRFALPLYLLNQTGSPALLGVVTAGALIPSIVFSPIGGMVADRVNKRTVMVVLDFFTAAVTWGFSMCLEGESLVFLLTGTLMLLYGIAGAYQPSVQASIPALIKRENLIAANAVINVVSSFSSLLGPALGGILYSVCGLRPLLWICAVCFTLSAIMEIFINIPFQKQNAEGRIRDLVRADFAESFRFIRRERPVIGKVTQIACGINLFLSSLILVGTPWLVTEVFMLGEKANQLYGFAQGALAFGGLLGGMLAGIFARRMNIRKTGNLVVAAALCLVPIAISLFLGFPDLVSYGILTFCCFLIMILATVFTVRMISFVQAETPKHLIGKVMSVILTISMCAQPLGNVLYGILFERLRGLEFMVILLAAASSFVLAICTKEVFQALPEEGGQQAEVADCVRGQEGLEETERNEL